MAWQAAFTDLSGDEWGAAGTIPPLPADLLVDPTQQRLGEAPLISSLRLPSSPVHEATGTLVLKAEGDENAGPSQLAWAVAAAGGKNAAQATAQNMFSPLKLESMFRPPTLPRTQPQRT